MFRPTSKELESCGFSWCTEYRPFWHEKNDSYHNKTIFLSLSKYKNIDYKEGIFYVDGCVVVFTSLEELQNLGNTRYFCNERELDNIKKNYPELIFDTKSGFYYSEFFIFRAPFSL